MIVAPRSTLTLLCSKGLKVDLGFFDDLLVPEYHFPAEYWFHSQDGLWVWKYEGNDMYLDLKEPIRCACLLSMQTHPFLTSANHRQVRADQRVIAPRLDI